MNSLEIHNLQKYYGKKHVLFNVSFYLPKGSILGLIGPNGAGKSTIMKSIVGLTHYSSGSIKINNINLTRLNRKPMEHVGSLIESPSLYNNLTAYDHLKLYNINDTPTELQHISKATGINKFINEKSKNLSLGMKQKLGIAITLLNHPELLILDEPMNGLDAQSTYNLRNLLIKLANNGISILISSHILSELVKLANYYVVINHGKIMLEQSAKEFLSIDKYNYAIKTSNNIKLVSKLKQINIPYRFKDNVIYISHEKLNQVSNLIIKNGINIKSINKIMPNIESKLLKITNH